MSWPADVSPGQDIEAAHINDAYLAVRVWGGSVDAASNNLSNVGAITAASVELSGANALYINAVTPTIRIADMADDGYSVYREAATGELNLYGDQTVVSAFRFITTLAGVATEAVKITNAGNVGIGTGTPAKRLQLFVAGSNECGAALTNGLANTYLTTDSTGTTTLQNDQAQAIRFASNSVERLRIGATAGEVYIFGALPGPYVDNTAAVAAGLTSGRLYRDSSNNVKQVQ